MIEIKSLQKIIGQQTVLDIDALQVSQGEIAVVVGSAGSGIEALFDLLIGRSQPSSGTIRLAGIDPKDRRAFSRTVGVMFYEDGLYQRQSPFGNYSLICRFYGLPNSRAFEVLSQVGMASRPCSDQFLIGESPIFTRKLTPPPVPLADRFCWKSLSLTLSK